MVCMDRKDKGDKLDQCLEKIRHNSDLRENQLLLLFLKYSNNIYRLHIH